jgi:single-strand DNA-binding protein
MSDTIMLTGLVATEPKAITTNEGLAITSFRLASTQRRFDRALEKWVDGDTNWYTITSFRQLAANAAMCLKKGERIVVSGRLRVREWQNGEKSGINVDVEADALGHDLSWGTSSYSRNVSGASISQAAESTASASAAEAGFPTHSELESSSTAESEELAVPF